MFASIILLVMIFGFFSMFVEGEEKGVTNQSEDSRRTWDTGDDVDGTNQYHLRCIDVQIYRVEGLGESFI